MSEFTKKFSSLGACKEGIDWCEANNVHDFKTAYRTCPAPEFMCWSLVRIMGVEGARTAVNCTAHVADVYQDAGLKSAVALCRDLLEGRTTDTKKLLVLAYDLTSAGLSDGSRKGNGAALISAAYALYCVVYAWQAAQAKDPEEKIKKLKKAAQHASDCASHAWQSLAGKGSVLPAIVRDSVKEDAALKAWASTTV